MIKKISEGYIERLVQLNQISEKLVGNSKHTFDLFFFFKQAKKDIV